MLGKWYNIKVKNKKENFKNIKLPVSVLTFSGRFLAVIFFMVCVKNKLIAKNLLLNKISLLFHFFKNKNKKKKIKQKKISKVIYPSKNETAKYLVEEKELGSSNLVIEEYPGGT